MSKVVLITGANGGIGSATAIRFANAGYKEVLNYHIEHELVENVAKVIGSSNVSLVEADVSSRADAELLVETAISDFGRIDVLVNNAGITRDRTLLKMSDKEWHDVLNTNLNGVFYVTRAVLPLMIHPVGGSIVNISSVVGEHGNFGQTNYAASKAALIGFTKSLAKEVAGKGIRVNAIAPGFADTAMTQRMPEEVKAKLLEQIPLKRFATVKEIADAIFFLANAPYITGTVLDVNGGLY
jgi:3-oxoacyl-(acyl-carrier-protein) reductase